MQADRVASANAFQEPMRRAAIGKEVLAMDFDEVDFREPLKELAIVRVSQADADRCFEHGREPTKQENRPAGPATRISAGLGSYGLALLGRCHATHGSAGALGNVLPVASVAVLLCLSGT